MPKQKPRRVPPDSWERTTCHKCGGTGVICGMRSIQGGICFACSGSGIRLRPIWFRRGPAGGGITRDRFIEGHARMVEAARATTGWRPEPHQVVWFDASKWRWPDVIAWSRAAILAAGGVLCCTLLGGWGGAWCVASFM